MLNSLLELKSACKDLFDTYKKLVITDDEWNKIEILVSVTSHIS